MNAKCDQIIDVLKKSDKPLKISEIVIILKLNGIHVTHDMVVNYFWGKPYRLIDQMEKHSLYRYSLKCVGELK